MMILILLLYCVQYELVECAIYDYSVHKLDPNYIEQKRQDTRDMCRLFNEDHNRLDLDSIYPKLEHNDSHVDGAKRRTKRELSQGKLSMREALKVEKIVDKLYDDLTEDGKRVTYRKNVLVTKPTVKSAVSKMGRRFDFAPAKLRSVAPVKTLNWHLNDSGHSQPWPKHWPLGIVPYYIDTKTYDNALLESIGRAFDYFQKATCIRLQKLRLKPIDQPSLKKVEWIYITNPMGVRQCVHSNSKKKNQGVQIVVLGYDCMSLGEILHEVMHVLGFPHEQNRPDRDHYVAVVWDNIKPGYKKYFEARTTDPLMNLPYDYASVLHYPPRAFSRNGQLTIRNPDGSKIGQRDGLSELDVAKVRLIYGAECLKRNQQYLEKTCPNIVSINFTKNNTVPEDKIVKYFRKRLWPYGIVNYKLRDIIEFTHEERENIKNVVRHIEKETCLVFRDFTDDATDDNVSKQLDHEEAAVIPVSPINPVNKSAFDSNDLENDTSSDDNKIPQRSEEAKEPEKKGEQAKRFRRAMPLPEPSRRHADHLITFVHTSDNGCECPTSEALKDVHIVPISGDCFNSANDLLHLFGHLLGLDHQHNMYDRDEFLTIIWDKLPQHLAQDMKTKLPQEASVGFEYDYQSVMHWPWLHVENGATNIIYPNWNDGWTMGHWQGLSATDVKKLNHIYEEQCAARKRLTNKSHNPNRR